MLEKKRKIGSRSRIEWILKKGYRARSSFLYLRYLPSRLTYPRFSVIVSGKVSRKAVIRNTVRRRVYEAIRRNLPASTKTCYDIVVLCNSKILHVPYAEIEKDVTFFIKKLFPSA